MRQKVIDQKKHMMGKNRIKILKSASFLDNAENKT